MDYSPTGSSVHGILQARILERVAMPFSRSSWPRNRACVSYVSCTGRRVLFFPNYFNWRIITLQYWDGFGHPSPWTSYRCTYAPYPEPPTHLPPHPILLGCPKAPALSALRHALNLRWSSILHMVIYMFQCYSLKSSHPRFLTRGPKVCSLHLSLSFFFFF